MTKKFNLSVSDELASEIENRRAYLGNLSKIFQEAIQAHINELEAFKGKIASGAGLSDLTEKERGILRDLI